MPDSAITLLRRGADLLAALPDPAAQALADALRRYEASGGAVTLDEAVGVACAPGRKPWWGIEAIERRDAALRALFRQHCAGWPPTHAARHLATMGQRYQAGAGRQDRKPNPAHALLETVARSGGFPGERRIFDIISK